MERNFTLAAAFIPLFALGQGAYTFDQLTEPYVELTGATPCVFDGDGFDAITELNGETFSFFGAPFSFGTTAEIHIGDFGFVRMDNDSALVVIDGLFTYLEAVDVSSQVSYTITGGPGEHVLTVQWKAWHLSNGPAGNYANWQIAIEQATGAVEVRIGPNSGGGMLYNDQNGPNCGIFFAPHSFTACYGKLWVEQDAYDPNIDVALNFDFDALHNLPPAGTVYRFAETSIGMAEASTAGMTVVRVDNDLLELTLPEGTVDGTLDVLDAGGRVLRSARVDQQRMRIPLGGAPAGAYVVRWTHAGGSAAVPFVKR
jgi:hypothetical protein